MQLILGNKYPVVVSHIVPAGVVVKLEDRSTQLIHLSNVSDQFVKSPAEYVNPGEKYEAECICGFNGKLQLSLKHLKLRKNTDEAAEFAEAVHKIPQALRVTTAHRPTYTPINKEAHYLKTKKEPASLDEMIAASNRSYQDKMRRSKHNSRKRK